MADLEFADAHVLQQSPGRGCMETGEDVCGVSARVRHDHAAAGVLLQEARDIIDLRDRRWLLSACTKLCLQTTAATRRARRSCRQGHGRHRSIV